MRRATRSATVAEVLRALDRIAPFARAADWDNVGLLAGWRDAPARRALLAIDLTAAVAREALGRGADLLIVYHPPVFKDVRRVTSDSAGPVAWLPELLARRVSVIALHTALDVAVGGTNDVLLDLFEPVERWPLEQAVCRDQQYKLVVFTPAGDVDRVRQALSAAGAGVIGHYTECSFELAGRGTFRGDETTKPAVGRRLVLERVDEVRLEMVVSRPRLGVVVRALYATHPYEEPAFDLYPLHELPGRGAVGMGRVGRLAAPQRGTRLVRRLARRVDLSAATVVGDLDRPFTSVTTAAGAFGVAAFRDPDSLVVTGEFKHHDALELQRRGVTAIQLGHWASERPVLAVVAQKLSRLVLGLRVDVAASDCPPVRPLRGR